MKLKRQILFGLLMAAVVAVQSDAQDAENYELPPINYSHTKPHDAVTRLRAQLESGAIKLDGSDREVVQELLQIFHIPVTSQLLVFSKTSFQKDRISHTHPRALYYTDDCYVGWVPDGLVEVAAIDPKLGPVFYSFDPRKGSGQHSLNFSREDDCMRCHGGQQYSAATAENPAREKMLPNINTRSRSPIGEASNLSVTENSF